MTLYKKLAITLFVLLAIFGLFIVNMMRSSNEMYQQELAQKLNHTLAHYVVAEHALMDGGKVNDDALEHLFHTMMVINPSIELYLLDPSGTIIGHAAPADSIVRTQVDLAPLHEFINGDMTYPLSGDDPKHATQQKVFSAARIPDDGPLQGYLYIILGGQQYTSVVDLLQDSYIFRSNSLVLLLALVIALVAGLAIFSLLTKRLGRLTESINHYYDESGSPNPELPHGNDELARLESAFHQMAARIDRQVSELQQTDNLRRELVANISHDLRTPLTTLQGYLETLSLKNSSLTASERENYLLTAIRHCKRLTILVEQLFELARLDSIERISYSEPFQLSELAQDIVQKYRLKANELGIDLQTDPGNTPALVHGDIGLLERVLENLIDNALRHTQRGGRVSVDLNPAGDHVTVRVADTGSGIPPERLAHIFDRFYRAETGTDDGTHHAGLGLAIARRIVELHGSTIEVSSEVGKGTAFIFDMQSAAA